MKIVKTSNIYLKRRIMKEYLTGIAMGFILTLSFILLAGLNDHERGIGRYEYYISSDDITKEHYSRIFDTATGVVYHKTYKPGKEQVDIKWEDGVKIQKKHFRPDISIWRSDTWEDFKQSYESSRMID